jgi:hypothetical protein
MGEFLLHPGVVAGLETPLTDRSAGGFELCLAGDVGSYVHVRNHVGAFVDATVGGRHVGRSGFLAEAFVGAGYLHTFAASPVYTVTDGEVDRIVDAGRPAFMPTASLGVGLEREAFTPFFHVQGFGQYPFNHHLLPHVALVLGVRA